MLFTQVVTVHDELNLTDASDDLFLFQLIKGASAAIESFCRRPRGGTLPTGFARAKLTEGQPTFGTTGLLVDHTPLMNLIAVNYIGASFNLESCYIGDSEAGRIDNPQGWYSTEIWGLGDAWETEAKRLPTHPNSTVWQVQYVGGYLMPSDDFLLTPVGTFTIQASGSKLIIATVPPAYVAGATTPKSWPALIQTLATVPPPPDTQSGPFGFNDSIIIEGSTSNDGIHQVAALATTTFTNDTLVLNEPLINETTPVNCSVRVSTLPGDVERACIETVKAMYFARDRDPATTDERIGTPRAGGWQGSYSSDKALPAIARQLLSPYRRMGA